MRSPQAILFALPSHYSPLLLLTESEKGKSITYTYKYNGYTFHIDAEVDAVQTHNAKDAIKSAWGVDINVSDDETTMSLQ